MAVDIKHYKSGVLNIHPHDCLRHCEVIKCDNKYDIWRCNICGKEWVEKCNFDEDFS